MKAFLFCLATAVALVPALVKTQRQVPLRAAAVLVDPGLAELVWSPELGVCQPDGTILSQTWTFRCDEAMPAAGAGDLSVSYVAVGDVAAPPLLLIHGFGANAFHWRANVNALALTNRVYAIDLIGFGGTDKPVIEYDADLWVEQCAAFLREVAGCGPDVRAVVAGNSIGGFTALALGALHPELVRGVASLNGAGKFAPPPELAALEAEAERRLLEANALDRALAYLANALGRAVTAVAFVVTKQPVRIQQVLRQVYPVYPDRCDDALVASIEYPARHPDAAEVFYRIVSRNGNGPPNPQRTVDALLAKLEAPLLLLWGEKDPWIVSQRADAIEAIGTRLGKRVERISIDAGHCPQDEAPAAVNAGLASFIASLPAV